MITKIKPLFGGVAKISAAAAVAITLAVSGAPQSVFANGHSNNKNCRELTINIALAEGQPKDQTISGTLCTPKGQHSRHSVDVLVHGATYDRSYWDFGYKNQKYSYVNRALRAGRTVFYYDRLGVGQSSRTDSTNVTMDSDAYALQQIAGWMKQRKHFNQVNVVGHSFGSQIALVAAGLSGNNIDRLVVTGSLQSNGPGLVNGELRQYPAIQDPLYASSGYDAGWLTSVPGTRQVFYYTTSADPDVIAYDEAHKNIVSSTQGVAGRALRVLPPGTNPTSSVHIPVLLVAGQHDRLYCGLALDCTDTEAVRNFEAPYYANAPSFAVVTIPDTGHDIALHPSAQESFRQINNWLKN